MVSKAAAKYDEWYKKTSENLNHKEEILLNELPNNFKYMKYWADKLRNDEPSSFNKIEKAYLLLVGKTGKRLLIGYSGYLKEANKHKKPSKVRISNVLRFVYYFTQDIYPCLIEAGIENIAKKSMQSFWNYYTQEIKDSINLLEDFQIDWILRYAKQSSTVGITVDSDWISSLQEMLRPPDPLVLLQIKNQLQKAKDDLEQDETLNSLILTDQCLELFLRDLCVRFGCDENLENKRGDKFIKWGFTDYLTHLYKNGEIDKHQLSDFFRFHDWRNGAQHLNLEPSAKIVGMVIDEIIAFINEHTN